MALNDRGFDHGDIDYEVVAFKDQDGYYYNNEYDPEVFPVTDRDLAETDYAIVQFTYPDGWTETRTFIGPFDGYEGLEYDIEEWYEMDT